IKAMYEKDGVAWWVPVLDKEWNYDKREVPSHEELAMENNGKALTDVFEPKDPTKLVRKPGEQFAAFGDLRDDGSTASG
ncbi:hypothetical protein, partial [Stenotrophomonas maltophilia]|uniref:hypothetical protein n=1 Tax=Stenotrophomonas maltophilia TaxID=40324 RepID=UPI0031456EB0